MKSISNILLLHFLIFSFIAFAFISTVEAGDRGYLFIKGGLNNPLVEIKAPSIYGTIQIETGIGLYLGGGFGYRILENLRLEGEVGYRANKIDDAKVIIPSQIVGAEVKGGEGDITSWSFLANIRYDFPIGKRWSMHLGGGIGAVQMSLKEFSLIISPVVPDPPSWKRLVANDKTWEFAYQASIGIAYQLSKSFIIDLDYSYFTTNLDFVDVEGNKFGGEHRSGNYQISMRYLF